jgi:hypothetical protein
MTVLIRVDGKHATRFEVAEVSALTGEVVDEVLDRAAAGKRRPRLLVYDRGSPVGRERLREAGWSYVGADGRVRLNQPLAPRQRLRRTLAIAVRVIAINCSKASAPVALCRPTGMPA